MKHYHLRQMCHKTLKGVSNNSLHERQNDSDTDSYHQYNRVEKFPKTQRQKASKSRARSNRTFMELKLFKQD